MITDPLKTSTKEVEEIKKRITQDPKFRKALAMRSHFWFFYIYFPHYIEFEPAEFHKEIFSLTGDEKVRFAVIVAFRGSGKSTIMSLSYPIWAIIGNQQKKYPLLIGQTQQQARQMLANIKSEFETNEVLIKDFGPFEQYALTWRADSLVLPQHEARISAISAGENIRGLRHKQTRPDLIICDDVEDSDSVRSRENRDKSYKWLIGDVVPAGDIKTKTIVIGNLLHEDALVMRLKESIDSGKRAGVFKAYPLKDVSGKILWPGKFPNEKTVEMQRKLVGDDVLWEREFLLNIIPDDYTIVQREWIRYYDKLPDSNKIRPRLAAVGVDLAISEKSTADYTAMIAAYVYDFGNDLKIYILPYPVNRRLRFPKTVEEISKMSERIRINARPLILVESVGYQDALIHLLEIKNMRVEGVKVAGRDKRERLSLTTDYIQTGKVLFPKKGAELLVQQLTGFGVEKHDDLADAFSILMSKIIETDRGATPSLDPDSGKGGTIFSLSKIDRVLGHSGPVTLDMQF